jgi:hypothetical protein
MANTPAVIDRRFRWAEALTQDQRGFPYTFLRNEPILFASHFRYISFAYRDL